MPYLKIPTPLRPYASGESSINLPGETVADMLEAAVEQHPNLKKFLFSDENQLRTFINLYLQEVNINQLQGLETPLAEHDTILIIPAIAGG